MSAHLNLAYDRQLAAAEEDSRKRFLTLLGPIATYLQTPGVYNVNVNEGDNGRIFVESRDGKFEAPETMTRDNRQAIIGNIAGKRKVTAVNEQNSRLSADLPHGFDVRFTAFSPPIGDWSMMFRIHATQIIPFSSYKLASEPHIRGTEKPPCNRRGIDGLRAAAERGDNILFSGGTNSGKTTAFNAYLRDAAEIHPHARLLLIQDRKELKPSHRDCIHLMARVPQARYGQGGNLDYYTYEFNNALEDALRTGFDMLAWGELRDEVSCLALLNALNTGARGFGTTLHADSAFDALHRIEDLIRRGGQQPIRTMIARFVDVIVQMQKMPDGSRQIVDIRRILGVDNANAYITESIL